MAMVNRELASFAFKDFRSNMIMYSRHYSGHFCQNTISDFEWKDYCPEVFRCIQELKNIDYTDYMMSVCADNVLSKISSSGKPGCLIPLPSDDRFVIRILRKCEAKVMLAMLPNYYSYLQKNQATLLITLYGLHVVRPAGGFKVYFAVQSNTIPSAVNTYRIYDLKGSPKGRTLTKLRVQDKIIFKDLDFDFCLYLDPLIQQRLLAQIKCDCEFLVAQGIMNYSLLIGIDMQTPSKGLIHGSPYIKKTASTNSRSLHSFDSRTSYHENAVSGYPCSPSFLAGNRSLFSPSILVDSNSSTSEIITSYTLQEVEDMRSIFSDSCKDHICPEFKFGVEMPARAVRTTRLERENVSSLSSVKALGSHDAVLYFSIVDIFQNYNMVKRIEHVYKSLKYDSKSIPAVSPKVYSSRFQNYLSQIFKAEDSV